MKKKWEECNKPYVLTLQYIEVIGQKAFGGPKNRPTTAFYKIYNFYKKLDESVLDLFHEYMEATGSNPDLSMRELFYKAPAWNQQQRMTKVAATESPDYLKLLENW